MNETVKVKFEFKNAAKAGAAMLAIWAALILIIFISDRIFPSSDSDQFTAVGFLLLFVLLPIFWLLSILWFAILSYFEIYKFKHVLAISLVPANIGVLCILFAAFLAPGTSFLISLLAFCVLELLAIANVSLGAFVWQRITSRSRTLTS